MGTHESQRDPRETAAEALDYMQHIRVKLAQPNRHSDYIINMDQTPIPFTFNSKRTLEMVGKKTINIRKSTNDTKRATLALTVTASGKMIRPMLIFIGTANGRIVKRDMPGWDNTFLYACQLNAWMDERCMLLWVELCLKRLGKNGHSWPGSNPEFPLFHQLDDVPWYHYGVSMESS